MKNTKLTVKFFLVISLFASSVMADGHMGGGGKTCNPQTQTCLVAEEETTKNDATDNSIMSLISDFLASFVR